MTTSRNDNVMLARPDAVQTADGLAGVRARVTPAEWQARVELAALYQLVAHFRWTDTIFNHISLRVPGEHAYLINPFGYLYEEITASCLVKVDVEGEILDDPTGLGINRAGFVIHGAIHAARPDIACVLHTHTRAGSGVSAQEDGLLPISQHAAGLLHLVGYHDFEGVALDLGERERLVRDLGDGLLLILRNHGLLSAGRTAAEALFLMVALERACEIQIAAQAPGLRLRHVEEAAIETSRQALDAASYAAFWTAMLRLAERVGPHYRT